MQEFALVIYTDDKLTEEIVDIQNQIFQFTGSRACLDVWKPHLTIGSAIRIPENTLEGFYRYIESVTSFEVFNVFVKDFKFNDDWSSGKFSDYNPYVVSLNVLGNGELKKLAEKIKQVTDKVERFYEQPWPYSPHITVAFKDLTKESFNKAKEVLGEKKFSGEFTVDHISLVKETQGKWQEFKRFNFGS